MAAHLRYFYVLLLLAGLLVTLNAIAGLTSSGDSTPIGHITQIIFGIAMVVSGGYEYLYPGKGNSPAVVHFAALVGFMLTFVLLFFLLHFYGITGLFSTSDSTSGLGATTFLFSGSVCLLFYSRSLRNKGLQ